VHGDGEGGAGVVAVLLEVDIDFVVADTVKLYAAEVAEGFFGAAFDAEAVGGHCVHLPAEGVVGGVEEPFFLGEIASRMSVDLTLPAATALCVYVADVPERQPCAPSLVSGLGRQRPGAVRAVKGANRRSLPLTVPTVAEGLEREREREREKERERERKREGRRRL